jgi:hypothetical protein
LNEGTIKPIEGGVRPDTLTIEEGTELTDFVDDKYPLEGSRAIGEGLFFKWGWIEETLEPFGYLYNMETKKFRSIKGDQNPNILDPLVFFHNGRFVLVGQERVGEGSSDELKIWSLNPRDSTWTNLASTNSPNTEAPLCKGSSSRYWDGQILVLVNHLDKCYQIIRFSY